MLPDVYLTLLVQTSSCTLGILEIDLEIDSPVSLIKTKKWEVEKEPGRTSEKCRSLDRV